MTDSGEGTAAAARTQSAIVVGVDGSAASTRALRWAVMEAVGRGAPLRIIAVTDPYSVLDDPSVEPAAELRAPSAEQVLAESARIAQELGASDVTPEHRTGGVIESLLDAAAGARMLVIGTTGVGERTGLSVGSSAQALAAHADCPVVIVPLGFGPELPTEGPVVVGVDGSPTSDGAVAAAFAAAAWRKAPLLAVHAWRDLAMPETLTAAPEGAGGGHTAAQREHDDDQAVLTRRLSGWRDHYPNVEVRVLVEMDRPVRTLARLASDAQLVVVGSRGRGGFTGMLLGSTSTALMHTLDVPLLIVRAPRRG